MHPTPPDVRTLNAWPAALRAALADRDSFSAYLPPLVHLELCDSPGRDLLTGYLLAADRRQARAPAWLEIAWVGPFIRALDARCDAGGEPEHCMPRELLLQFVEEAVYVARVRAALQALLQLPDRVAYAIGSTATTLLDERQPGQVEEVLLSFTGHASRLLTHMRNQRQLDVGSPPTLELIGEVLDCVGGVLECVPGTEQVENVLVDALNELIAVRPLVSAVLGWNGDTEAGEKLLTAWRAALLRDLDLGRLPAEVYSVPAEATP
jgi:hypothetical protein